MTSRLDDTSREQWKQIINAHVPERAGTGKSGGDGRLPLCSDQSAWITERCTVSMVVNWREITTQTASSDYQRSEKCFPGCADSGFFALSTEPARHQFCSEQQTKNSGTRCPCERSQPVTIPE